MEVRVWMRNGACAAKSFLVAVLALLLGIWLVPNALSQQKKKTTSPATPLFTADIDEAWMKAGGERCRMQIEPFALASGNKYTRKPDLLPGFVFPKWKSPIAKLPEPDRPFGVDVHAYAKLSIADVKMFGAMKNLQVLILPNVGMTDEHITELVGLSELHTLSIGASSITNKGLKELAKLPKLARLSLILCDTITPASAPDLVNLTSVESLSLAYTRIGDEGVKKLAAMKQLKELSLATSGVTDAIIPTLAALPRLEKVDLIRTKVTDAGVAELLKARPKLEVLKGETLK